MELAFCDANVVIGDGRVLERATVVVQGDRIVRVTPGSKSLPRLARKVDASGLAVLPGLIDGHVHLCLDASPDPMKVLEETTDGLLALRMARSARETLLSGVTTIRDLGGKNGVDLIIRDAITRSVISGPRMLASARPVAMTGGHGWQMAREADGPSEVRKAVREQIKAGADVVKFMATGGVMTKGVEPASAQLTEEELKAGIEEAHKAGRRTSAHAQGTQGILNALKAGIDSIEHGVFLDEEAASLMVQKGVFLVPTICALHCIEKNGLDRGIPQFAVEKTKKVKESFLSSLRLARETGIQMAMGTDAGTPFNFHGRNALELELMVHLGGFTPQEAIEAATIGGARLIGRERELGTIEEGKLADLIVVRGNPLEDIRVLQDREAILWILKEGEVIKEDGRVNI